MSSLEEFFRAVPDPTREIAVAVDSGEVAPDVVTDLFWQLTTFLEADASHARVILYLPFALIPPRGWGNGSAELESAADQFVHAYEKSWRALLTENDVRANFVDGNILEPEFAPDGQEMVKKAAHLIPWLAEKGVVSVHEMLALAESTSDDVLRQSIVDTFPALLARGLIREEEARQLNESFAGWARLGRPYVTLKAGLTLDAKIASNDEGHRWITSDESRARVQQLRHQSDAVLTGIGTVLADDPLLTDRSGRPRRRPLLRVVLDAGLRLPLDSQLVRSAKADLLVFCGEDVWMGKREKLEERGVEVVELKEAGGRLSLLAVLKKLAERQITSVLVEAGARVNAAAIETGVVDKVWLFYAPKLLGADAVPFLASTSYESPVTSHGLSLLNYRLHRFGPDFAVEGYLRDVYGQ